MSFVNAPVVLSTAAPGVGDDSADGYIVGQIWIKTTATIAVYICTSNALGAAVWTQLDGAGGGSPDFGSGRLAKTATYTIVLADKGKIIDLTANTVTINLDPAATLGDGFIFGVYNSGSGVLTLDANGAETIRDQSGASTTKTFAQGFGAIVFCDGTGFKIIAQISSGGSGPTLAAGELAGRASTSGSGNPEPIQLGPGLSMVGSVLSSDVGVPAVKALIAQNFQ